jgi:transcriptional regulator with XRE-family HTH domain
MIQTEEDVATKSSPDDVRQQFIDNRDDKSYRHAYADESLNLSIATQIKVLREQRRLRQKDLAALAAMKQSMISMYENVNYSSWSINTLKKLAEAFDVILDVRFRSFRDLVSLTQGFARESLQVPSFCGDPYFSEGYTSRQVYVTYAQSPQAVRATINSRFLYDVQQGGDIGSPKLVSVPDTLYNQYAIINPRRLGDDFSDICGGEAVILGVNNNLINPEGVMYAEEPEADIQSYPSFIGGPNREWGQRASAY